MASKIKSNIELWYNTEYGREHLVFDSIEKYFKFAEEVNPEATNIEVVTEYIKDSETATKEFTCSNIDDLSEYLTKIQLEVNDSDIYKTLLIKSISTFKDKYAEEYMIVNRDHIEISVDESDNIKVKCVDGQGIVVKEEVITEDEEETENTETGN